MTKTMTEKDDKKIELEPAEATTSSAPAARKELTLADLTKLVEKRLRETYETSEAIQRQGTRIVIPESMTYDEAANAILAHKDEMEKSVQTALNFSCHQNDGLVCFNRALNESFGHLIGMPNPTFFGVMPPRSLAVPVGYGKTESVYVGNVKLPGFPIVMNVSPNPNGLQVIATHARKYLPLVREIERLTNKQLREASIFKGQAFDSDFEYIEINVDRTRVVYNADEDRRIERSIFTPIRKLRELKKNGVQIKRGVLLYGTFGTGKSLTAAITSHEAIANGWTFIAVKPGQDFRNALTTAKRYAPAVVFVEDIDVAVESTERTNDLNQILEVFDGVITKSVEVMVVMTTNRIESMNRAMLRPGRLDDCIELKPLIGEAVARFVVAASRDSNGESMLSFEMTRDVVERIASAAGPTGMVPAFLAEAVKRAKITALINNPKNPMLDVDSIVDGIESVKPQLRMMTEEQAERPPRMETVFADLVRREVARAASVTTFAITQAGAAADDAEKLALAK